MKVIDPGHKYELSTLDGDDSPVVLTFVKRVGANYPGNESAYAGTTLQETLRACLDRLAYLDRQLPDPCNRCESLMTRTIRNVPATDVQADEIWGFIYKKEKNKKADESEDETFGDCYTWVAIDRHSKLILAFVAGRRTADNAMALMRKVRRATSPDVRFQLSTDGLQAYIAAVDEMLSDRCDYGQLVKSYSQPQENERRYSPADCTGSTKVVISGNPDKAKICTSHIERQNLTMRMQIRRLTRLTNGFSKKLENHRAAIALHFGYYNFCKIHGSLRVTPAMESGVTDRMWTLAELLR